MKKKPKKPLVCPSHPKWYSITSDEAWAKAQEKGYRTVDKRPQSLIRMVHCTKEQWLELDTFHNWLQDKYGRKHES